MKPIKSRTFLVQQLLIVLATTFAVLGLVLAIKSIPFFPSLAATQLETGEIHMELGSSPIGLNYLALYLSYICLYLVFEFYSFKPAFYASINIGGSLAVCYGIASLILGFTLDVDNSHSDQLIKEFLNLNYQSTIALALAVVGGFGLAFFVAAAIKALTRNYFMFIRFPIASILGMAVFVGLDTYLKNRAMLAPQSMLIVVITPLSQYIVLVIASVIPLYLLRLFLGLFRGRIVEEEVSVVTKKKSFFKSSVDAAPPPTEADLKPSFSPQPVIIDDKHETTVSQKIKFDVPTTLN